MSNVDPAIEESIWNAVAEFHESDDVARYLVAWFEEVTTSNDDREVDLQRLSLLMNAITAPPHVSGE